jgi:hypothetical protein
MSLSESVRRIGVEPGMERKPEKPPGTPSALPADSPRPFRRFLKWLIGVLGPLALAAFTVWLTANYEPDLELVTEPPSAVARAIEIRKVGQPEWKGKFKTEEMEARFRVRNKGLRAGGIDKCNVAPLGVHVLPNVYVTDIDRRPILRGKIAWRTVRFRYDSPAIMEVAQGIISWQINCFDTAGTYVGGIKGAAVLRKGEKPEPPPYDLLLNPRQPDS